MNPEVLKEFLVSLGFSVDTASFGKFQSTLSTAANTVAARTGALSQSVIGWQTNVAKAFGVSGKVIEGVTKSLQLGEKFVAYQAAVLGAFGAVSGAVLGLAEHVASAEQEYRLFGLRMGMTEANAKKLKMALDELGQPIEVVTWDPEVHRRYLQLLDDQDTLQAKLGADYSDNMRSIRDLGFEFHRLHMAFEYLGMAFINAVFKAFGTTITDVTEKLRKWINAFDKDGISDWADKLAEYVVPILKTTWKLFQEIGLAVKEFVVLFTNVIGLLTGDDSIEGTEFSFEKLGTAIEHVTELLADFVHGMTESERFLIHMVNAITLALAGKGTEAIAEFNEAFQHLGKGSGAIMGAVAGTGIGTVAGGIVGGIAGTAIAGPLGGIAGAGIGAGIGGALGAGAGGVTGAKIGEANASRLGLPETSSTSAKAQQAYLLAQAVGAKTGINPRLIYEQWAFESAGFGSNVAQSNNNLAGIRIPGTKTYERFDNLSAFADRYTEVLNEKRYLHTGTREAKTEEEYAAALKAGSYMESNRLDQYVGGMKRYAPLYDKQASSSGGVTNNANVNVGAVNVNITQQPGANAEHVHEAAKSGVEEGLRRYSQQILANLPSY